MKNKLLIKLHRFLVIVMVSCGISISANAQIPRTISYQGAVTDATGKPIPDGTHALKLTLYDAASGGTQVYTESQSVPVLKGVFNVYIGSVTPIPTTLTFGHPYFLGVAIDGAPELSRTAFSTSPYAFHSGMADTLFGGAVTNINGTTGPVTLQGSGSTTLTQTGNTIVISSSGGGGGLTLPYAGTAASSTPGFAVSQTGTGNAGSFTNNNTTSAALALEGITNSTADNAAAIRGSVASTSPGNFSVGVVGANHSTTNNGIGVMGTHAGKGWGVYGTADSGIAVIGYSGPGYGIYGQSSTGYAGYFATTDTLTTNPTILVDHKGHSSAIYSTNSSPTNLTGAITGINYSTKPGASFDVGASGVFGSMPNASAAYGSAGVRGLNYSTNPTSYGVFGENLGAGYGVFGQTTTGKAVYGNSTSGIGVVGNSTSHDGVFAEASDGGNAFVALYYGAGTSTTSGDNIAIFQTTGGNRARIDNTGKGFFDGGTQNSGADVAEAFDVAGIRSSYEPGDVLVISTEKDRTVEKSAHAYSTNVVGVYATKPGVLLTEQNIDTDLKDLVPMGVVGVIPTKVCNQNGVIHRGDLLVTSSKRGYAMKANQAKVRVGMVIGKALENFTGKEGKISVLVNVK